MATQADGTVYINSSIDTDGMVAGGKEIEAAARRAAKTVKGIGDAARIALERQTAAFVKSNQLYAQQEQKVKDLERQLEEMAEQKVATSAYTEIEKEISKLETALDKATQKQNKLTESGKANALTAEYIAASKQVGKLNNALLSAYNRKEKFLESGGSESSRAFKNIEYDIEKLESQLRQAISDKEDLESSKTQKTDAFIALEKEIDGIKQILTEANAQKEKLESSGGAYQAVDTSAVTDKLIAEQQRLQQMGEALNVSYDSLKSKVEQYGGSIAGAAQKHGLLRKTLSSVAGAAKKAGAAMLLFHKNTKKSNGSMGSSLKTLLKYGLGIRSLYVLFNKIRNAVKEGFKNLAQYSEETNTHLSALKSSLTQLKNSLATAFNPILTVISPILTKFINMLSQAVTYVGMFFAALTGKKSFTKAVAVQEKFADSLGDTADNAKEAKKYLSGLDEIRTYSEDKDTSSGGGAGGVSPSDMFEDVNIPDFISDWVKKFKEAWENADFTEIGTIVGTKLKNSLDRIPWDGIKSSAQKIAKSTATFLNGFFETPGLFESIGKTAAEGINTGLTFVKTFLDEFHWDSFGKAITKGISSFFGNIDWNLTGGTISSAFIALFDFIKGLIKGIDWSELPGAVADAIVDFFDGFDFKGAFQSLGELVGSALRAAFDLAKGIGEFIAESAESAKEYFQEKIEECGGNVVAGILKGITDALVGIGTWIFENIIDPFMTGLLGEDTWEGIKESGKNLIEGLYQGIKDFFSDPLGWIKKNIVDPFVQGFKDLFGIHSPSTVMEEQGGFLMQGLLNGISAWVSKIREKFNEIKETILSKWEDVKSKTLEKWSDIKSKLSEKWNDLKSSASGKFGEIKEKIIEKWENLKSKTSEIWKGIEKVIKSPINAIIGFINSLISGVTSGINTVIKALNKLKIDVPSWVTDLTGIKGFGFNLSTITAPQIPYLATGAVIPPNAPFMAVLGDQNQGTNIETPEALLRKVVREESGNNGFNGTIRIPLSINGRQVLEAIITEAQLQQMMNGRNPFEMA